jgi:phosphoribosyl 1,2-cyclic phosphate phosphodiesterase
MIGCGCAVCTSADPRDTRCRSSIYVEGDDDVRILVDTTPDLRHQALRHGVTRVDAILFTHAHADHIMGLDEVRRFNVLGGGTMPIYGDAWTLEDIRRTFSYVFTSDAPRGGGVPDLRLWPIAGPFCIGRTAVVPVPIAHGRSTIFGFRMGPFAYLTDCSAVPDASMPLLEDLDVVVLDALRRRPHPTHMTLAQAVALAQRIGARQTYFTHIAHDLGHAGMCAELPDRMAPAHDGLVLTLPARAADAAP